MIQTTPRSTPTEGSTAGAAAAGIILFCAPLGLVVFLAVGMTRNSGPNPNGATPPQSYSVAPDSPVRKLLNVLEKNIDVKGYLNKNGAVLTEYKTNLESFLQKVQAGDAEYANLANKDKVVGQVESMLATIRRLQQFIASGDERSATAEAEKLKQGVIELQKLSTPSMVQLAVDLARENIASGYTKYQYASPKREPEKRMQLFAGSGKSDCSSFASYIYWRGTNNPGFKIGLPTSNWLAEASRKKYGLSFVLDGRDTKLSSEQVLSTLQPGDVVISDSSAGMHAVVYVGGGFSEGDTVHSTSGKARGNGIQFTTMERRLRSGGIRVLGVIRYGGETA